VGGVASGKHLYNRYFIRISMDAKERLELIKRGAEDIITEEDLLKLVKEKKQINAYWGIAPTGPFHMGYLASLGKIFDLQKAGVKTKILLADIHSALDDLKAPWEEIKQRAEYYKKCIELPWKEKPEFVIGSSFQLNEKYQLDVLKIATLATVARATRAASEVTRMKNPKVSELIYPIMQALDEEYLGVDVQLGGIDQRHIMAFAREYLPKIGYSSRVELMNPLMASLKGPGTKMSASVPESHLKVYDSEKQIKEKIKNAYCPTGNLIENPITQLCQYVIFPVKGKLEIERPVKYGGDIVFNSFEELKAAYTSKKIHPLDLKNSVANVLIELFKRAREYFEKNKSELKKLGKEFLP